MAGCERQRSTAELNGKPLCGRPITAHKDKEMTMDTKAITAELAQHVPVTSTLENVIEDVAPTDLGDMHTLYSDMGWLIAERFSTLEDKQRVFELIELGMRNGDGRLKDAVSTGLIEAMISRTGAQPARWRQISAELGPLSSAYVRQ